jgi:hypothetical protein
MKKILVSAAFLLLACNCGSSSGGGPSNDAGPTVPNLTVVNFDGWCTVTQSPPPVSGTGTYTPGTVVSLSATANTGFMWGYWTGTAGANAGNDFKDPNMMTTVTTIDGNQTVVACCPSATLKCT